jgi:hypothetical protein
MVHTGGRRYSIRNRKHSMGYANRRVAAFNRALSSSDGGGGAAVCLGGPAARSYRPKAAILARLKGNNTRRPLFFSACVGMVLVNNSFARNISRREVGGPAQRLQAAVEQLTGEHSTPTLDFFRAISAVECLVVSIVPLYGWRQA